MSASEVALARFEQGYSCSQAVFSALAETRGVPAELALHIGAGLGGGIARTGQTCGCLTGAILAIGLAQPSVAPEVNRTEKDKTCERARRLITVFQERNGSSLCRDLLDCDVSTPEGYARAKEAKLFQTCCPKLLRDAVEIAEGILAEAG
ncbi:MAG: C-GCAxxG-C-C family protein [Bryobacteraceae bacterium]